MSVSTKTFFLTNTAATNSPWTDGNRQLTVAEGTSSFSMTFSPSETQNHGWVFEAPYYNAAWDDGVTITLRYDAGGLTDSNIRARARVVSLDSSDTILQSGTFTGWQTTEVDRTFSITAPTWTHTEDCTNRVAVEMEFNNIADHGSNITISMDTQGTDGSDVDVTIVYRDETCWPHWEQKDFRFRNDDGTETTATWDAAANTDISLSTASDDSRRIRFNFENDGNTTSTVASGLAHFEFEYSKNSGAWTALTTSSSNIKIITSANYADGADTTQQLGSGTFETNNNGMDETGQVTVPSNTWNNADLIEIETFVQVINADVADGDTIDIRITPSSGSESAFVNTYTQTPRITVSKPTGAGPIILHVGVI
jgi:hypothetical protein